MDSSSSRSRAADTLLDCDEPPTWVNRTHFAGSVCYPVNGSCFPLVPAPITNECNSGIAISGKGYPKLRSVSMTDDDLLSIDTCKHTRDLRSSPILLKKTDSATPRRATHHNHSFSLGSAMNTASIGDVNTHTEFGPDGVLYVEEVREKRVYPRKNYRRDMSWSEYLSAHVSECTFDEEEDWMIDLSELFVGHKFASGTYSRLYVGMYRDSEVAVKILRQPDNDEGISRRLERQFRSEVGVLSQVHHRNVIKFFGACHKPPVCCIITEYLALGSVRAYLHNQPPFSLSLKMVIDMALDIAQGMEYLHSQGVIHRDLKSENLLIADDLCVKITDFGVACFESDITSMTDDIGTYRWMAPEMISKKEFSKKADVYSFGIVLWELLTGHTPFEELSPVQAAFAVVHKHARPPLPLKCPSALGQLMHQCWSTDPNKRPDFLKVVQVLKDMEFSQLDRNMSIMQLRHKHNHPLLHCFGIGSSH